MIMCTLVCLTVGQITCVHIVTACSVWSIRTHAYHKSSANCLLSEGGGTIAHITDCYLCRDDDVRVLPGNNGSLMIQAAQQGKPF